MPRGFGFWLWWSSMPYWLWWRRLWFPWLPRWWWTGLYGPITPFAATPYLPKEWEITILEDLKRFTEEELKWINKRLEELQKKQSAESRKQ